MKSLALYIIIALSGLAFGGEIVASHVTRSLALLISAYHMLYNILSLLLLVVSRRISKEKTIQNTFGWARVNVLGMLINMLFLSALCFAACVESVQTMVHASHEDTEPRYPLLLLCLGVFNVFLNIFCFILIGGYTHHQGCSMIIQGNEIQVNYVLAETDLGESICPGSNVLSSKKKQMPRLDENEEISSVRVSGDHRLLDLLRDISSALGVVVCACVVLFMKGLILKYADAILAISSVVVLLVTTYPFIRESGLILLQSIPNHIDIGGLTSRLLKKFPEVQSVHDLHVWRLTASEVIATVHISLSSPSVYCSLECRLNEFFEEEGISLVTIQPEFFEGIWPDMKKDECILQCSSNNNCGALTCCGHLSNTRPNVRLRCVTTACQGDSTKDSALHQPRPEYELPLLTENDLSKLQHATETVV